MPREHGHYFKSVTHLQATEATASDLIAALRAMTEEDRAEVMASFIEHQRPLNVPHIQTSPFPSVAQASAQPLSTAQTLADERERGRVEALEAGLGTLHGQCDEYLRQVQELEREVSRLKSELELAWSDEHDPLAAKVVELERENAELKRALFDTAETLGKASRERDEDERKLKEAEGNEPVFLSRDPRDGQLYYRTAGDWRKLGVTSCSELPDPHDTRYDGWQPGEVSDGAMFAAMSKRPQLVSPDNEPLTRSSARELFLDLIAEVATSALKRSPFEDYSLKNLVDAAKKLKNA